MLTFTQDHNSRGQAILIVERGRDPLGHFRLVGSGHRADLEFRYYKNGPQSVVFPMASWPNPDEVARIVHEYVDDDGGEQSSDMPNTSTS